MPHFALNFSAAGPIINVFVGVTTARRDALTAANLPIPNWVKAVMLVDTGASCTCLDPQLIAPLGIQPTGISSIQTPSTQGAPVNYAQYDVQLIIPGKDTTEIKLLDPIPVVEAHLKSQGIDGLIGRDALSSCLLIYDGQHNLFTLAF